MGKVELDEGSWPRDGDLETCRLKSDLTQVKEGSGRKELEVAGGSGTGRPAWSEKEVSQIVTESLFWDTYMKIRVTVLHT